MVRLDPSGARVLSGSLASGRPIVLVPAEDVLIVPLELPAARRSDRLKALPWAMEERLADPVDDLHFSLGQSVGDGRYLVAAVRRTVMLQWLEGLRGSGIDPRAIVPDALCLPVPEEGHWSVAREASRVLVRTPDGGAFCVDGSLFEPIWQSAGAPPIDLRWRSRGQDIAEVLAEGASAMPLDLAFGAFAPRHIAAETMLRRFGIAVVAITALHGLIVGLSTLATAHLADRRAVEAAGLHDMIFPAGRQGRDVAADIAALTRSASAPRGALLPLLARVSEGLRPLSGDVSFRKLSYTGEDGSLAIGVDARDFAALQRIEATLSQAGFSTEMGPAAAVSGGVEGQIRVRGGSSP